MSSAATYLMLAGYLSTCGFPTPKNSPQRLPAGIFDAQAAMLSDILPTGSEIGVQYGQVKIGDVVAVIGAGPVGLAAITPAVPFLER